jgi:hypothetical protein
MRSTTDAYGMDVDVDDSSTVMGADDEGGDMDSIFPPALLAPSPDESDLDDVRRLARAWVRERGTPGVLAWEGDVLDSLLDKLEQQVSVVEWRGGRRGWEGRG